MTVNLYKKMGGFDAVRATVDLFYAKVLEDPLLCPLFEGKDMNRMRCMFRQFMVYAWGGSEAYKGKDMKEAHKNMDLTEEHFDAVTKLFEESLQHLGVPQHIIDEVVVVLQTSKPAVLNSRSDTDTQPTATEANAETKESNTELMPIQRGTEEPNELKTESEDTNTDSTQERETQ